MTKFKRRAPSYDPGGARYKRVCLSSAGRPTGGVTDALASGAIYAGKDDKFIEAAVAGEATVIVSGDQHLLNLSTYGAIRIIPAREFLHQLEMHSAQGPESSGH